MDRDKETELLNNLIELIKVAHPDAKEIMISFDTKNENFLYANSPCILCTLEEAYKMAITNGATHKNDIVDFAKAFVDALLPDDDEKSQNEKELLEFLRNYKSDVKN